MHMLLIDSLCKKCIPHGISFAGDFLVNQAQKLKDKYLMKVCQMDTSCHMSGPLYFMDTWHTSVVSPIFLIPLVGDMVYMICMSIGSLLTQLSIRSFIIAMKC